MPTAHFATMRSHWFAEETDLVKQLAQSLPDDDGSARKIAAEATKLVNHTRAQRREVGGIDALMQQYDLSSSEGVTLMCLAEALLRVPDASTQDALIQDKLADADFTAHLGESDHLFVNASTFGLMLAGRTLSLGSGGSDGLQVFDGLLKRLGTPAIRLALRRAMGVLGGQFVFGETIAEAIELGRDEAEYQFSFDMLGEGAWTKDDATRYYQRYIDAIAALGTADLRSPQISVKLSALHPRFEVKQTRRVIDELQPRLLELCQLAANHGVAVCIDAEEADRLELTLMLLKAMATDPTLQGWDGLGLAVQAYQRRALPVVDWLAALAQRTGMRLNPRLVKGAYWDTEIKRAQLAGMPSFPVFTVKAHTDVSYLACARKLLSASDHLRPCFATHNANTVATLLEWTKQDTQVEFQRLHGMGQALHDLVLERHDNVTTRVYAPVGEQRDLLAYLVRRLLENGANSSFVNRIAQDDLPVTDIVRDQAALAAATGYLPHADIAAPQDLFGPERKNSPGLNLANPDVWHEVQNAGKFSSSQERHASPIIDGRTLSDADHNVTVRSPINRQPIGTVLPATADHAQQALTVAQGSKWPQVPAAERAGILGQVANQLISRQNDFLWLLAHESGKTLDDAHSELRETIDFFRFYANEAVRLCGEAVPLPSATGEANTLQYHARGPFLCIAPWNFPLAIFGGQVAAALAAGCPVLAKPAEQTPLVATALVKVMLEAGVPGSAVSLLPGDGATIANAVIADDRLAGVAFTGSTATAQIINRNLAARTGPIIPLIAETGGINAMIVDSTALAEQVTRDVVRSAFQSAGQRCSALRLLCLQDDIADAHLAMIHGAMAELRMGDPWQQETDVGPVIDAEAQRSLTNYCEQARARLGPTTRTAIPDDAPSGWFVTPTCIEVSRVADVEREVFGPVLHVVRYAAAGRASLVEQINALGYGLTLSVHSRNDDAVAEIAAHARVGNLYVNRDQIGAVVGAQPFGGEGLSGTGPKAGGPNYVLRFLSEQTISEDTTAAGGNRDIMTL